MGAGYALTGFHSAAEYWRCFKSAPSILRHRFVLCKTPAELAESKVTEGGNEMKRCLVRVLRASSSLSGWCVCALAAAASARSVS